MDTIRTIQARRVAADIEQRHTVYALDSARSVLVSALRLLDGHSLAYQLEDTETPGNPFLKKDTAYGFPECGELFLDWNSFFNRHGACLTTPTLFFTPLGIRIAFYSSALRTTVIYDELADGAVGAVVPVKDRETTVGRVARTLRSILAPVQTPPEPAVIG